MSTQIIDLATAAGSPAGDAEVIDGAVGPALTALDALADPVLVAAANAESAAAGGALDLDALLSRQSRPGTRRPYWAILR